MTWTPAYRRVTANGRHYPDWTIPPLNPVPANTLFAKGDIVRLTLVGRSRKHYRGEDMRGRIVGTAGNFVHVRWDGGDVSGYWPDSVEKIG
jgi:hypothetical protein